MRGFDWLGWTMACSAAAVLVLGCDGDGGGEDGGTTPTDAGPVCQTPPELREGTRPDPSEVTCPDDMGTPAPEEQMGTCCWRHSNADQLDTPEFRLTYIEIVGPAGSPLSSTTVRRVLNESVQFEEFNWLFRVEGAEDDGPVNIVTGFGRRMADGTYQFSQGSAGSEGDPDAWCPVEVPATLTGDTVTSDPIDGSITVPVFDDAGVEVQIELTLRNIAVQRGTLGEDRSCIGWNVSRPFTYQPGAVLTGFVEVEPSREQVIRAPGVETNVCAALAGSLSLDYCDVNDQSEWAIKPDSLCDETGCRANTPCEADVCDPATECNAWRFVAHFAGAGVDITNGVCGG
jgi:hypothetical protein